MAEAKKIDVAQFKELDAYKLVLNTNVTQFLAKYKLKMR